MSKQCEWLHRQLESLPLVKCPFRQEALPQSGIYFFYEDGENWGHGGNRLRIVRVGTHKKRNFGSRISEHFLLDESKMDFDASKPKPSDRSIFRKNIGRAFLNRDQDPYLEMWEPDFILAENRERIGRLRDIKREKELESEITRTLRESFLFRFIIIESENERIGAKGLESRLIGTVAQCKVCGPSHENGWEGIHPNPR